MMIRESLTCIRLLFCSGDRMHVIASVGTPGWITAFIAQQRPWQELCACKFVLLHPFTGLYADHLPLFMEHGVETMIKRAEVTIRESQEWNFEDGEESRTALKGKEIYIVRCEVRTQCRA